MFEIWWLKFASDFSGRVRIRIRIRSRIAATAVHSGSLTPALNLYVHWFLSLPELPDTRLLRRGHGVPNFSKNFREGPRVHGKDRCKEADKGRHMRYLEDTFRNTLRGTQHANGGMIALAQKNGFLGVNELCPHNLDQNSGVKMTGVGEQPPKKARADNGPDQNYTFLKWESERFGLLKSRM